MLPICFLIPHVSLGAPHATLGAQMLASLSPASSLSPCLCLFFHLQGVERKLVLGTNISSKLYSMLLSYRLLKKMLELLKISAKWEKAKAGMRTLPIAITKDTTLAKIMETCDPTILESVEPFLMRELKSGQRQ